jgi:hypothetical protein
MALVPLLFLQAWWINDVPPEYSVMGEMARLRGNAPSNDRPRFLTGVTAQASLAPEPESKAEPFSWIAPLWKEKPAREPAPIHVAALPTMAALAAPALPSLVARTEPTLPAEVVVAQAPQAPPPTRPAPPPPATAPAAQVGTKDVETLVAMLVSFYEAGDTDRLMGLYDASAMGFFQRSQVRQAYENFFRATRTRQLRVDHLNWNTSERSASAKGAATVIVEYFESGGRVERSVDIDLDIALRDGHPRIQRLYLFPNGK